ncbi:unnamed protein product [Calypogeia fissa]
MEPRGSLSPSPSLVPSQSHRSRSTETPPPFPVDENNNTALTSQYCSTTLKEGEGRKKKKKKEEEVKGGSCLRRDERQRRQSSSLSKKSIHPTHIHLERQIHLPEKSRSVGILSVCCIESLRSSSLRRQAFLGRARNQGRKEGSHGAIIRFSFFGEDLCHGGEFLRTIVQTYNRFPPKVSGGLTTRSVFVNHGPVAKKKPEKWWCSQEIRVRTHREDNGTLDF